MVPKLNSPKCEGKLEFPSSQSFSRVLNSCFIVLIGAMVGIPPVGVVPLALNVPFDTPRGKLWGELASLGQTLCFCFSIIIISNSMT